MKRTYSAPVMYREAYIAEQYIAASDCGTHVGVPDHGHVQIKGSNEVHCAFTASNCGANATSCRAGQTSFSCDSVDPHQAITTGSNLEASKPSDGHNCHILSNNADAANFAANYKDDVCAAGVAYLMTGDSGFTEIETAFS